MNVPTTYKIDRNQLGIMEVLEIGTVTTIMMASSE
jgi:hypothetical protein